MRKNKYRFLSGLVTMVMLSFAVPVVAQEIPVACVSDAGTNEENINTEKWVDTFNDTLKQVKLDEYENPSGPAVEILAKEIENSIKSELEENGYVKEEEGENIEEQNLENQKVEENKPNEHYTVFDNGYPAHLDDNLQDWVYQMCNEYNIPGYEKLIMSKLYCESSYRTNLIHTNTNGTKDYGIAQINSSNHARLRRELGINDFLDPYQSIRAGVYMMSECLADNGYNESSALAAYNTGRNGLGSTKYSRRVLAIKDSAISQ